MVKPLSIDLRARIALALSEGATCREAAKRFSVSVATAVRVGQMARSGRGLAGNKIGGYRKPTLLGPAGEALETRMAQKSDWTVRALAADLQSSGIAVSHDTVWRFLRSRGFSFKKNSDGQRDSPADDCTAEGLVESKSASG